MDATKFLIILDLDHTLIYGSFAEKESADLLFRYHKYLTVYERPLARELIEMCKKKGDIMVYTTALRRYAKMICVSLDIKPIVLLSRKNCKTVDGKHKKLIKEDWLKNYDKIIIIDDSPNVWLNSTDLKIKFLVPNEFRGNKEDMGLQNIISSNL
jgi:TFIIF-interacting CTD phosphatase-like protein